MHIKDHSAAMKFFRTYDNVASKGKWKEFVDEMEFDSMLQEPRTMAHGGRIGCAGGRLVKTGPKTGKYFIGQVKEIIIELTMQILQLMEKHGLHKIERKRVGPKNKVVKLP